MKNYIETHISQISDPAFQTMVAELCYWVSIPKEEFHKKSLRFFFDGDCTSEEADEESGHARKWNPE